MINYSIFVGLDVHKDSITVAMARSGGVLLDKVNATGSMVKGCNKSYKLIFRTPASKNLQFLSPLFGNGSWCLKETLV